MLRYTGPRVRARAARGSTPAVHPKMAEMAPAPCSLPGAGCAEVTQNEMRLFLYHDSSPAVLRMVRLQVVYKMTFEVMTVIVLVSLSLLPTLRRGDERRSVQRCGA